jgi:hypothetical protein
MLTLIELIYEKKKHEKLTLACKGDTLPASLVWFHHNLAGFSNSNNDFCCFLSVITLVKFLMIFTINGQVIEYVNQYPHLGHIISVNWDDAHDITQRRKKLCGQINSVAYCASLVVVMLS